MFLEQVDAGGSVSSAEVGADVGVEVVVTVCVDVVVEVCAEVVVTVCVDGCEGFTTTAPLFQINFPPDLMQV